jgi:succinoglycan biosynthesis protein ExoM
MSGPQASPGGPARAVLVGVCTFQRPSLEDTLRSLLALEPPSGVALRLAVADNDERPSAEALVRRVAAEAGREVAYLHRPARNISLARNALIEEAERGGVPLLAFLDDDEWVGPDWLARLIEAKDAAGADAVFGPVHGIYAEDAPAWMRRGAFHDCVAEIDGQGRVRTGYSANVLLDLAAPALRGLRFDLAYGRTGGEDTAFFDAAKRAGAVLAPAPLATSFEHVPAHRARAEWLARRRYRMGQTHGELIGQGASPAGRLAMVGVAGAKAAACLAMAAAGALSPERRNRALLRGCLHAGVVSRLLGSSPLVLYGGPEPTSAPPSARAASPSTSTPTDGRIP